MPEFLWRREESPARRLALAPLWLAEGPYRLGAWLHRTAYRRGWLRRHSAGVPVVCVGNLTVGGSAKTPVVAWLARELQARGRNLAVLSRGVGGARATEVNVVSDGERLLRSPAEVGDEPVLIAGRAPGVPVLAGRNRTALALRAEAVFGVEALLVDDGFQHHRLARQLDLVCVDAALGLGNGHVLPRGPLREPPGALRFADAILCTRADEPGQAEALALPALAQSLPRFALAVEASGLRALGGSAAPERPLDELEGAKLGMLAAIARPDRLAADLERLGGQVVERRVFADHHRYTRGDVAALDPALHWVTTAKDAVKLPAAWVGDARVSVLEERVRPHAPAALLDFVEARLDAARAVRSAAGGRT